MRPFRACGLLTLLLTSACTQTDTIVNPVPPVPVPTDLRAAEVGEDYAILAWEAESFVVVVEGRRQGDVAFSELGWYPPWTESCEVEVEADCTHEFRIAARDGDRQSNWSDALSVTARSAGYWEVRGGVMRQPDDQRDLFFEFGTANRFSGTGVLWIEGPEGWADDEPFTKDVDAMVVTFEGKGAVTGDYHLRFNSASGRNHEISVFVDATDVLPPVGVVVTEPDAGLPPRIEWLCEGATAAEFCFGWGQEPFLCAPVAVPADTSLWLPGDNLLIITAYRSAADRQPAMSVWQQYDVRIGEFVVW